MCTSAHVSGQTSDTPRLQASKQGCPLRPSFVTGTWNIHLSWFLWEVLLTLLGCEWEGRAGLCSCQAGHGEKSLSLILTLLPPSLVVCEQRKACLILLVCAVPCKRWSWSLLWFIGFILGHRNNGSFITLNVIPWISFLFECSLSVVFWLQACRKRLAL